MNNRWEEPGAFPPTLKEKVLPPIAGMSWPRVQSLAPEALQGNAGTSSKQAPLVYKVPQKEPLLSKEERASVTSEQCRLVEEQLRQKAAVEGRRRTTGYDPDRTSRETTASLSGAPDIEEMLQLIDADFLTAFQAGNLAPPYEQNGDDDSQN